MAISQESKTLKWRLAQRLERWWWRRYLKGQSPETYREWKSAYWKQFYALIESDVALVPGDTIADIGCGPAGIFSFFRNNPVTAVDPLLDSYEGDLDVFKKSDYPNTRFITSSIEDFEAQEQFNLVCCLNAINHVSDLPLAFSKLYALTNEGGYCALSIDAHNHAFLKHLFRTIPGDALHPHQYDLQEYEEMMVKAGFRLLKTELYKKQPIFNYYLLLGKKEKA